MVWPYPIICYQEKAMQPMLSYTPTTGGVRKVRPVTAVKCLCKHNGVFCPAHGTFTPYLPDDPECAPPGLYCRPKRWRGRVVRKKIGRD